MIVDNGLLKVSQCVNYCSSFIISYFLASRVFIIFGNFRNLNCVMKIHYAVVKGSHFFIAIEMWFDGKIDA